MHCISKVIKLVLQLVDAFNFDLKRSEKLIEGIARVYWSRSLVPRFFRHSIHFDLLHTRSEVLHLAIPYALRLEQSLGKLTWHLRYHLRRDDMCAHVLSFLEEHLGTVA